MPAKSIAQQRFFGMVYAFKTGELKLSEIDDETLKDKIKKTADQMSEKDIKKYAETEHDDLPQKIKESLAELGNIPDIGNATFPQEGAKGSGDQPSTTFTSIRTFKEWSNKTKKEN